MACDGEDPIRDTGEVERLFRELEARGLDLLAPIERDIVAALRARPLATWCASPLRMLRCLHAKAHGRPWTEFLPSGKSE
jgi:hypothetical protein